MHRAMALSTIIMNAAGVCVAVLFAVAAHTMPEMAAHSGPIYVGVLVLATFASERIGKHILRDDPDNSPPCCETAVKVSRVLLVVAWIAMILLLLDVGFQGAWS